MFTDAAVLMYWEEWKQMWEYYHALAMVERRVQTKMRLKTLLRQPNCTEQAYRTGLTAEEFAACCRWQAAGYTVTEFATALQALGRAGVSDLPIPPDNSVAGRIRAALGRLSGIGKA